MSRGLTWVSMGLALVFLAGARVFSAEPIKQSAQASTSTINTNLWLHPDQIPKSVFDDSPNAGRDPFFPKSARRGGDTQRSAKVEVPVAIPKLTLMGISGPPNKRVAVINNRNFAAGEEGEVVAGGVRVRIRCIEIRDESVIVSAGSPPQRFELHMQKTE